MNEYVCERERLGVYGGGGAGGLLSPSDPSGTSEMMSVELKKGV